MTALPRESTSAQRAARSSTRGTPATTGKRSPSICRRCTRFRSADLLLPDVRCHLLLQHLQRQGAVPQDDVVKVPDIEPSAELLFRAAAQLGDFQLTHLIGERLAGPADVTIDFSDR